MAAVGEEGEQGDSPSFAASKYAWFKPEAAPAAARCVSTCNVMTCEDGMSPILVHHFPEPEQAQECSEVGDQSHQRPKSSISLQV